MRTARGRLLVGGKPRHAGKALRIFRSRGQVRSAVRRSQFPRLPRSNLHCGQSQILFPAMNPTPLGRGAKETWPWQGRRLRIDVQDDAEAHNTLWRIGGRAADGNLAGIEVKAGSGVGKNDFRHLVWFRDHFDKGRRFVGIVLYSGRETLSFGNGMLAVPMSVLWS